MPERGFPHVTAHQIRPTAASLMIADGANIKTIQTQLGYASAATTGPVRAPLPRRPCSEDGRTIPRRCGTPCGEYGDKPLTRTNLGIEMVPDLRCRSGTIRGAAGN